jgi:hypothetical protein
MKFQSQDRRLQTSCKNCIFAIYSGLTQVGCFANRIDKFDKTDIIEAYDNEKEFYVVNKFCNLYRPLTWNGGVQNLDKAMEESTLNFDIMIDCNEMSEEFRNYLIDTIPKIEYYKNKTNINLFHNYVSPSNVKSMVLDIYSRNKTIKISACLESKQFLHEFVLKSKRNCHMVVSGDFDFANLNKLNDLVNQNLEKFIIAKCGEVLVISNMAYRMNYANSQIDNYKNNIDDIVNTAKNIGMYIDI